MKIYCCGCEKTINARLTDGSEIYPHRADLHSLPFWKCDKCLNYVGCHYKTKNKTRPLGCIPTAEIKNARKENHKILDPIWKSGKIDRKEIYSAISDHIGWNYHTAKIKDIEDAREIYRFIRKFAQQLGAGDAFRLRSKHS
jgi:hypothetical protein